MTTHVKLYAHTGVTFPKVHMGQADHYGDAGAMLRYPYLAREVLEVGGDAVMSGEALSKDMNVNLLSVEVVDHPNQSQGKARVRFELVPNGHDRKADGDSPLLVGGALLEFGPDWRISFIEADAPSPFVAGTQDPPTQ